MSKITKLYKDFFGLSEATQNPKDIEISADALKKDQTLYPLLQKQAEKQGGNVRIVAKEETELEEAQLINRIQDYQGGVQMIFADPATAKATLIDILTWAKGKGLEVITKKIYTTKSGAKAGYIHFRVGDAIYKDSQRVQGYVSQSPGVEKFRFKLKQS